MLINTIEIICKSMKTVSCTCKGRSLTTIENDNIRDKTIMVIMQLKNDRAINKNKVIASRNRKQDK